MTPNCSFNFKEHLCTPVQVYKGGALCKGLQERARLRIMAASMNSRCRWLLVVYDKTKLCRYCEVRWSCFQLRGMHLKIDLMYVPGYVIRWYFVDDVYVCPHKSIPQVIFASTFSFGTPLRTIGHDFFRFSCCDLLKCGQQYSFNEPFQC